MNIVEVSTVKIIPVEVVPIDSRDYKILAPNRYYFDWNKEKTHEVYKLIESDAKDILGLVSIEKFPVEWRVHIRLLTVSKENMGRTKKYDKIAGNLIAHVAKIALAEYGVLACVSLRPKSQLIKHYMTKYNMNMTGMTLSLEVPEIFNLINLYDHE